MIQEKLDRINALARAAKERELTAEELEERAELRKEYLAEWRLGVEQTMANTYIDYGNGKIVKVQKKKKN